MVAVANAQAPVCVDNVVLSHGDGDEQASGICRIDMEEFSVSQQEDKYSDGGDTLSGVPADCVTNEVILGINDKCAVNSVKKGTKICFQNTYVATAKDDATADTPCTAKPDGTCATSKTTALSAHCLYETKKVCGQGKFFYGDKCKNKAACQENETTALTAECLDSNDQVCAKNKFFYGSACKDAAKSATTSSSTSSSGAASANKEKAKASSTSSAVTMGLNALVFATIVNLL